MTNIIVEQIMKEFMELGIPQHQEEIDVVTMEVSSVLHALKCMSPHMSNPKIESKRMHDVETSGFVIPSVLPKYVPPRKKNENPITILHGF